MRTNLSIEKFISYNFTVFSHHQYLIKLKFKKRYLFFASRFDTVLTFHMVAVLVVILVHIYQLLFLLKCFWKLFILSVFHLGVSSIINSSRIKLYQLGQASCHKMLHDSKTNLEIF